MTTRRTFLGGASSLAFSNLFSPARAADPNHRVDTMHPDLILHNGRVTTLDRANPNATAIAIKDGLFLEVGADSDIMAHLSALHDVPDYEIYMVADASGGTSLEAHNRAMDRMVQAGVIPVTWQQVLLEWQRDWARKESYDAVTTLVKEHSGAYGMGIDYAYTMVHGAEERVKHGKRIGPNPVK